MTRAAQLRSLGVPADVARLALQLSPADYAAFIREMQSPPRRGQLARSPGPLPAYRPARTADDGAPRPPAVPNAIGRAAALAMCSPDQREALARAFPKRGAAPVASRDALGRLVTSHIGAVPEGATRLPNVYAPRAPWRIST